MSSCMAENANFLCREIAGYVAERLNITVEFVDNIPWQERERLLDEGKIHICWICGLPYIWKADRPAVRIELLAAPVMRGERYRNRPDYFSDIVVRRESGFETFADLRGAAWVYNEPRSHSGFNLVGYHLAMLGETWRYFGSLTQSGAHQSSLQLILNQKADASAIDSTVLEFECRQQPELASTIRVIHSLGPSPIPPWVMQADLPAEIKKDLRDVFLHMHEDPTGAKVLTAGSIAQFVPINEADYDPIRSMARQVVHLNIEPPLNMHVA